MAVAVVALGAGCTPGIAPEVNASERSLPATDAPPTVATAPATEPNTQPTSTLPAPPSTSPTTTSSPITTTTATPKQATIADEFAAALSNERVTVLGAPVPVAAQDSIARLWLLLGRPPTDTELTTAVTAVVRDGVPLDALATLLLHSSEQTAVSPDAQPAQFVAGLYETMLGRQGKPSEVTSWVKGIQNGMSFGDVAVGFAESPEAVRRTGTVAHESLPAIAVPGVERKVSDSVLRLYLGLLRRLPTVDELARDVDRDQHGAPLGTIADTMLQTNEYRRRRPDGDAAAVLAGLFEDVLGSRPAQAVIKGWADQLEAAASPGEVAAAFTESAAVVARTATERPMPPDVDSSAPPAVAIMPGTQILAVGDSIMLGASSALDRQFPGIAIDAKVGRQFSEGVEIVRALAAAGTIPGTVIVHLGTNGTVSAAKCDDLFGLLAGKRVVLVNLHVPRPWEGPNNDVLAACAARHGATVIDWHNGAVGLAHDGYHLGGPGPAAYASLIAAKLAAMG